MDMYFSTVFTDAYIGTICTGFTVDDVMGSLHLYGRWRIPFYICRKKVVEYVLNGWFIHGKHLPLCQKDCGFP